MCREEMNAAKSPDEYWMRRALEEARTAFLEEETPIGAVAVLDGACIAANHNRTEQLRDPTAHAEMLVIRECAGKLQRWRLVDVEIYVTVEPCPMCAMAAVLARIPRLVFGAPEPRTGAGGSFTNLLHHPALNHRITVVPGVLAGESAELMRQFFRNRRRNPGFPEKSVLQT